MTVNRDREKRSFPRRKVLNLEILERTRTTVGIRKVLGSNAHGVNVRQIIMESQVASALH